MNAPESGRRVTGTSGEVAIRYIECGLEWTIGVTIAETS